MKFRFKKRKALSFIDGILQSPMHMPQDEFEWVRELYQKADTILEYGSGRSTLVAAELAGKTVFSVESDKFWMNQFQEHFDANPPSSKIVLHHTDIGATKEWGNPVDDSAWQQFHRYPASIWDHPEFTHPDVVLIDGRFRSACFATVMIRTKRPVTVLFDDYRDRTQYHEVETFAKLVETRGRMAMFELSPRQFPAENLTEILEMYTKVS